MHSVGMALTEASEPSAKVFTVGAEAENMVFSVGLDVDVPNVAVVDI